MKGVDEKIWVVEWSERQKRFHLNKIDKMLKSNMRSFLRKDDLDWRPLAMNLNYFHAWHLCDELMEERGVTWGKKASC
jgi:hypothetical protein